MSSFIAKAQTVTPNVVASDGGYVQTTQGSVAWTTGEPVSESYITTSNSTTMGFLQPDAVDMATLIKEQGDDKQILIYPNPVKDELYINFSGIANGTYGLELTDALGKLIYKTDADVSTTSSRVSLKVSEVAAGAYFLRVTNKDFNKVVKLNKVD